MIQTNKSRLLISIAGGLVVLLIVGYCLNWNQIVKRAILTKLGIMALREQSGAMQEKAMALQTQMTDASRENAKLKLQNTALADELKSLKSSMTSIQTYLDSEQFYGRAPAPQNKLCRFLALETSIAPDPARSTYPNCLRTIRARVLHAPPGVNIPREIILTTWAFRDRRSSPDMNIQAGDQFRGVPLLPEQLGLDVQEIQRADTIDARSGDCYYYLAQAAALPSKRIIHAPPLPPPIQRQVFLDEVERSIKDEVSKHGGDWQAWMDSVSAVQRKLKDESLTSILPEHPGHQSVLASGVSSPLNLMRKGFDGKELSNVEQVCLLAKDFERRGMIFIYVPIPLKQIAWPELFIPKEEIPADGIVAPQWRKYVLDLVSSGIEVVDLQPIFRKYISEGGKRPLYFYEHHWAPAGFELAAKELARHLRRFIEPPASNSIVRTEGSIEYMVGDRPMSLSGFSVWRETPQGLDPFSNIKDSPIVLCGDSNVFHVCNGAPSNVGTAGGQLAGGNGSFPAQLAFEMQTPVSLGGYWGPFAIGAFQSIPAGFFASKKVVVYIAMMTSHAGSPQWGAELPPDSAFGK